MTMESLAPTIVSTLLILLAFAVAWGALQTKTETMDVRLGKVEKAIDRHHGDNDRHVDIHWRKQQGDQMNRIENLLVDHLTHGGAVNR